MKRGIQTGLLSLYGRARRFGFVSSRVGDSLTAIAYFAYKSWFERHANQLRPFLLKGTAAVDVGANIGYFSFKFARWLGEGGRVIAMEPAPTHHARLTRTIRRRGLDTVIEAVAAAASDHDGTGLLTLNPENPADHRLGPVGVPVRTQQVDDLLEERGDPFVSLMKIDVQGAELKVLTGARRTLNRCRPAIFIEVDDVALEASGSSANELINWLVQDGYVMHALDAKGIHPVDVHEAARIRAELGYADFLFLHHLGPGPQRA